MKENAINAVSGHIMKPQCATFLYKFTSLTWSSNQLGIRENNLKIPFGDNCFTLQLVILIAFSVHNVLILLGEILCWSPLRINGIICSN